MSNVLGDLFESTVGETAEVAGGALEGLGGLFGAAGEDIFEAGKETVIGEDLGVEDIPILSGSRTIRPILETTFQEAGTSFLEQQDPTNITESILETQEAVRPETILETGGESLVELGKDITESIVGEDFAEKVTEDLQNLEEFTETVLGSAPEVTAAATQTITDPGGIFEDIAEAIPLVSETTTDEDLSSIASRFGYDIERLRELRARLVGLRKRQAGLLEEVETATGRTLLE